MSLLSSILDSSVVHGRKVVTSADPAASAAGVAAYAQGGNAFDAALAACFMEGVCLPMKCGLGGDLVALYRHEGGPWYSALSIGPGAKALASGAKMERIGPKSVGIPGAPAGYNFLASLGKLPLEKLIAPAVAAADHGVQWGWVALSYTKEAEALLKQYNAGIPYLPEGRLPILGEIRKLPGLGRLLERFAKKGARLFAGEDGDRLVESVRARGGILTLEDMQVDPLKISECTHYSLGEGVNLVVTPSPSSGDRLASIMSELQSGNNDLLAIVRNERVLAKQKGRETVADGTSVVTAADEAGNAVVVVHSNSFPQYGSCVVLDDGLILNNRPGRGFDLDAPEGSRSAPKAGKVPPTTLHAWVLQKAETTFAGATPGGVNQLPWNAQTLSHLLNCKSIAEAICLPKWALDEKGTLTAEEGCDLPASSGAELRPALSHRAAQQILDLTDQSLKSAAADPRVNARALATY